jgi:hypothetical protein
MLLRNFGIRSTRCYKEKTAPVIVIAMRNSNPADCGTEQEYTASIFRDDIRV